MHATTQNKMKLTKEVFKIINCLWNNHRNKTKKNFVTFIVITLET